MNLYRLLKLSTAIITCCLLFACAPPGAPIINFDNNGLYSAALADDGTLALISSSQQITLWDLTTQQPKYQWWQGKRRDNVIAVALSNNSHYAATLSNNSVVLWNTRDGQALGWWQLAGQAQSVAVANNGQLLIGLADASVLYLATDHQRLLKFIGHQEKVNSVALSRDGSLALTGGNGANALLWRTSDAKILQRWPMDSRILQTALSADGRLAFVSDSSGHGDIWNIAEQRRVSTLTIRRRQMNFTTARFIQQDTQLLTGTPDREWQLWRVANGEKLRSQRVALPAKPQPPSAVVYAVSQWRDNSIQAISSSGLLERWNHP